MDNDHHIMVVLPGGIVGQWDKGYIVLNDKSSQLGQLFGQLLGLSATVKIKAGSAPNMSETPINVSETSANDLLLLLLR